MKRLACLCLLLTPSLLAAPAPDHKNTWSVDQLVAHLKKKGVPVKAVLPTKGPRGPWRKHPGHLLVLSGRADGLRVRALEEQGDKFARLVSVSEPGALHLDVPVWAGGVYVIRCPDGKTASAYVDELVKQGVGSEGWQWGRFFFIGESQRGLKDVRAALGGR